MMRFALLVLAVLVAEAVADVSITKDEVMCNCKAPYNKMYINLQNAVNVKCKAYPSGSAGFASCVATALGYLSNEGRSFNQEAMAKDFANLPFVASCNPKLPSATISGWVWPGNFNYADMEKSLAAYFDCVSKTMESDCNNSLAKQIRGCNPGN